MCGGRVSERETVVVKCGGAGGGAEGPVCGDVAAPLRDGHRVVLAHGGSADIDRLGARLGVPQRQLVAPDGVVARYTDDATLEVLTLALAGAVKPRLVELLAREGVAGVGLTGLDRRLLLARRKAAHRARLEGVREGVVADGAGERPVLAALAGGGTRIELEREGAAA